MELNFLLYCSRENYFGFVDRQSNYNNYKIKIIVISWSAHIKIKMMIIELKKLAIRSIQVTY